MSGPAGRRWLILCSAMVSFFAVGMTFFAVPPLVPELVLRFGLDRLRIGVLMGAIAAPAVFLSIPLGAAVDRWPARAAGAAGLGLMAVGASLFAAAPCYLALLLGRLLFGIGGLAMNLLLARQISSAFAGRELARAMGLFNSVYPASMIAIYSLHPRLVNALGWRGELLALAGLAVIALPLHLLLVPPGRVEPRSPAAHASQGVTRTLAALAAAWALFFGAFASLLTFAPEWSGGGSQGLLVVTLVMWTALVLNPLIGTAIDRWGHATGWLAGGLVLLGAVLVAMATATVAAPLAMILTGCAAAAVLTATYSLPVRIVPPASVGFAFGFITAFSNLATLLGPALTGGLLDRFEGWAAPWATLGAACLAGAALASGTRSGTIATGSVDQNRASAG